MKWYQIGDTIFDLEKVGAIVEETILRGNARTIKIYLSGGQGSPVISITGAAIEPFKRFMQRELKPKTIPVPLRMASQVEPKAG